MIKFKLGEYDVEISAYNMTLKDHEKDTLYLLNQLSIISGLAANVMCDQGYEGLAGGYREFQNDFFRVCYENGLYKRGGEMTLYDFLHKHVPDNAIVKVIWPERNRTITGRRPDFRTESRLLEMQVFDFQISNGLNGYNCLIWATSDKDNLILQL